MFESKPLVAFDQHAASVTAAVLFPGVRRPAVHQLVPDLPTIRRFVKKLRRHGARPLLLRGQPLRLLAPADLDGGWCRL